MLPLPVQPFWEELLKMLFNPFVGLDAPSVRFEETIGYPLGGAAAGGHGLVVHDAEPRR